MYSISDCEITTVDDSTVVDVISNFYYTGGCPAIMCSPFVKPKTLLLLVGPSELMFALCACVCIVYECECDFKKLNKCSLDTCIVIPSVYIYKINFLYECLLTISLCR